MLNERIANTKLIFRTINDDLDKILETNAPTQLELQNKLKVINEELCDYVVDMVSILETFKIANDGKNDENIR